MVTQYKDIAYYILYEGSIPLRPPLEILEELSEDHTMLPVQMHCGMFNYIFYILILNYFLGVTPVFWSCDP